MTASTYPARRLTGRSAIYTDATGNKLAKTIIWVIRGRWDGDGSD
ncbi:MAG TPA: hypothetical protein VHW43_02810 [Puia sp.]|nr:hypothetical protein [Puia sp.]